MADQRARISRPGGLLNPGWFKVASGRYEGQWHISAWFHTAILVNDWDTGGTKWFALAICPICAATIVNDDTPEAGFGRNVVEHERWHARNDLPLPEEER
jgi:hypothetical protein